MTERYYSKINTWIIVAGFLLQLAFTIYNYGKVTQKLDDVSDRVQRIEQHIDNVQKGH